jgi:hypothetical protein
MKAMYKGAGSNILRGLAGALVLVSFDYCKNFYLEWKYPELRGQKKVRQQFLAAQSSFWPLGRDCRLLSAYTYILFSAHFFPTLQEIKIQFG